MTSLYNNTITRYYDFVFTDLGDTRTNHWLLLGSPVPGATILGVYLYFVLSWGPRYMLHRKPYDLQNVLVVYNFIQVLASIWLFWEAMDAAWWTRYSWKCEPVDWSTSPEAMRIAWAFYMYFLAKISELLDTVFFVLRKKDRQITFLHMYHHTVMPMISWGAAKYYPGGHGAFIGMINSFVHIIMYTYYMMAAMGPQFHKYLWWKKYITTLQLSQFCLAFLHSFQLLIYDCEYPRWSLFLIMPNAVFFYYLFNDFYNKAYGIDDSQPRRKPDLKSESNVVANGHSSKSNGHVTKQNGHVTKQNGHVTKQNGHVNKSKDHMTKENGIVNRSNKNGHVTKENGHVTKEIAHVTKESGHMTSSNGHVISSNVQTPSSNGNIANGNISCSKSNCNLPKQSPKKTQ